MLHSLNRFFVWTIAVAAFAQPADWIISARYVITMDPQRRVIEDGAVAIKGERIAAVGERTDIERKFGAKNRIHESEAILIPGLVNTHTHAPMSLLRGIADDLNLQDWLEKYIFPAEAKNVTPEFVRTGTQLACMEMLLGGTTTYTDMYYFEEVIAEATKQCGMRAVLGQTIIRVPVPDAKTPDAALLRAEAFIKKFLGDSLITPAVAPHAVWTNTDGHLRACREMANMNNVPLLIHLSETKKENDDLIAARGMTPTKLLEMLGVLDGRVVAAHGIWIDDNDLSILKRKNVGVAHCPSSNMKLSSGVAPVLKYLENDMAVGLGPDGPAGSNNDFSMFEEMDLAAKLQKVITKDPRALPAQQALEMATIRGARVLGLQDEIGSLEQGKRADLVVVSLGEPNAVPMFNVYSQLVYALKEQDVRHVMVNGKLVVRNRQILTLKRSEVISKAEELKRKVQASLHQ